MQAQRSALKNAQIVAKLKEETSRIGQKVAMANKKAELENAFNRKLQEKISELDSGDGQEKLLQEAMASISNLRRGHLRGS